MYEAEPHRMHSQAEPGNEGKVEAQVEAQVETQVDLDILTV